MGIFHVISKLYLKTNLAPSRGKQNLVKD